MVWNVSRWIANRMSRRMRKYYRCFGCCQCVEHGWYRYMRKVDYHTESIHFGHNELCLPKKKHKKKFFNECYRTVYVAKLPFRSEIVLRYGEPGQVRPPYSNLVKRQGHNVKLFWKLDFVSVAFLLLSLSKDFTFPKLSFKYWLLQKQSKSL